jgi:phosphatidylglycerophosphate synthase
MQTREDFRIARHLTWRDVKAAQTYPDAWWVVFVIDPLARPLVWLLAPIRAVTPMMVTMLSAVLGLASIWAFLAQHPAWGAVLFEVHFLFDCVDGKLARVRGETSFVGAVLDEGLDTIILFAVAAAAAIQATLADMPYAYLQIAVAAAFGAEASLRRIREAQAAPWPVPSRFVNTRLSGRLLALPWTLDLEALALFVAPLLGGTVRLVILAGCLVGLCVISASYIWALLADARLADRESGPHRAGVDAA